MKLSKTGGFFRSNLFYPGSSVANSDLLNCLLEFFITKGWQLDVKYDISFLMHCRDIASGKGDYHEK
jgi:hypothetical protein